MTFPYDQARLNALVAEVDSRIENVERTAAEASRAGAHGRGLSDKDIAELERHALGPNAPKALQEMVKRIKEGELSWSDVLSGRALDDEGVQRAMAESLTDLREAHNALREGQDPQDVADARATGSDDDDDPDGGSILRPAW